MSRQASSWQVLQQLGSNEAVVKYLDSYLQVLIPEEERNFRITAEAALFDNSERAAALVRYGRVQLARDIRTALEPFIKQYTR